MKIRAGYEISYDCAQPTPIIAMLNVHSSRLQDLVTPDLLRLDPAMPSNSYQDGFGNPCHVIRAPRGRLTMSADFVIRDSGRAARAASQGAQYPFGKPPVDAVVYVC